MKEIINKQNKKVIINLNIFFLTLVYSSLFFLFVKLIDVLPIRISFNFVQFFIQPFYALGVLIVVSLAYSLSRAVYGYLSLRLSRGESIRMLIINSTILLAASSFATACIVFIIVILSKNPESGLALILIPGIAFCAIGIDLLLIIGTFLAVAFFRNLNIFNIFITVVTVIVGALVLLLPALSPINGCEMHRSNNACVSQKALEKNNASICELSGDPSSCYAYTMNQAKDAEICSTFQESKNKNKQYEERCRCYTVGDCEDRTDLIFAISNRIYYWDRNNKNNFYLNNAKNKEEIDLLMKSASRYSGTKVDYNVFSSNDDDSNLHIVIKVKYDDENKFYCKGYGDDEKIQTVLDMWSFDKKVFCNNLECTKSSYNNKEVCLN